jgi:gamma-glutamylcyclotransferase (GGCT)/AIG2-like uncharacterized protein YtfP
MKSEKPIYVFVYGTLRPGGALSYLVPGVMYDLGWYPGVRLMSPESGSFFTAEKIEVTPQRLQELDDYEGYHPTDPSRSLYLRVPYLDGWIYTYNRSFNGHERIHSGDWLEYTKSTEGSAARDALARPFSNSQVVPTQEVNSCCLPEPEVKTINIDPETQEMVA